MEARSIKQVKLEMADLRTKINSENNFDAGVNLFNQLALLEDELEILVKSVVDTPKMPREIIIKITIDPKVWEGYEDVCDELLLEDSGINDLNLSYEIIKPAD